MLAGSEPSNGHPNGQPYIFDWVVLREVEKYVSNTVNHPRKYARVIMVDDAWESKIDEHNLRILNKLEQREAIDLTHIRKEEFAGESYRGVQYDLSDAMVAIGGGKGTYIAGQRMTALLKPVLPMDIKIGALSEDGQGAVQLRQELMTDPIRFFPNTHKQLINRIDTLSLIRGVHDVAAVAQRTADMLAMEFRSGERWSSSVIRPLVRFLDSPGLRRFMSGFGLIRIVDFFNRFF